MNAVSNAIRCLAADTVQSANSGHPGAPMGMAPAANVLFSQVLSFDPSTPDWPNRDRFVLSNGHASALIYSMLHLSGYKLSLDDLKKFRQLNSKTPGHPERGHTPGVEVTTGPLGQGLANGVGLAIAEAHLRAAFRKPGFEDICSHFTFVFCGDGCLMEGVALEAMSLAGHLGLGRLIVVYDDNKITIDGSTALAFTEDVPAKARACGWRTAVVADGDRDHAGILAALLEAKALGDSEGKPTLISLRTTIGYGSKLQGTEKVHGAPLGAAEIARVKSDAVFSRPSGAASFAVEPAVYAHFAANAQRGAARRQAWAASLARYAAAHPALAADFTARFSPSGGVPDFATLVSWLPTNAKDGKPIATRKASENAMAVLLAKLPSLLGGSADLTHSNLTRPAGVKNLSDFQRETPAGRVLRYGVREHAMAAAMNGLDAHGGVVAYGATFLNFIGYALGAVRLSAMSGHGVIYVATHDSIGLGEDGPTHQPVELLSTLRCTPNLHAFRPADQTETSAAWALAVTLRATPSVLCLSRGLLPPLAGTSAAGVAKGGYVVAEASAAVPLAVLVGTGSELHIAVAAKALLEAGGVPTRVVSMPCTSLFDAQPLAYRRSVFPAGAAVVAVEAYMALGWERYAHAHVGMASFGASAPDTVLYKHFGITPERVAAKAKAVLGHFKGAGGVPASPLALAHL